MRYQVSIFALILLACVPGSLAHIDNPLLPEGCGSCHVGHGEPGQPMLEAGEEKSCYQCHGSEDNRARMKASGRLATYADPVDIEKEFQKIYRHPVEEGTGHDPSERLPDQIRGSVTHSECVDCHNPHERIHAGAKRSYKVPGYTLSGQYVETSSYEYEICLKCHAEEAGVGRSSREVLSDFSTAMRSQHPVALPSSGGRSPSLNLTLSDGGMMKCSDCHTNDNHDGPRGPHGSRHEFLLSGRYDRDPYAQESPFAYEFCYSCHDRSSILGNESFPLHREHIVGDPVRGISGTSCYTCHVSHGSRENLYLLQFNPEAVTRDGQTGRMSYDTKGEGHGECYLTCHGYEHSPAEY